MIEQLLVLILTVAMTGIVLGSYCIALLKKATKGEINDAKSVKLEPDIPAVSISKTSKKSITASENHPRIERLGLHSYEISNNKSFPVLQALVLLIITWIVLYTLSFHVLKIFPLSQTNQGSPASKPNVQVTTIENSDQERKRENIALNITALRKSLNDVQLGRYLFTGKIEFINQGPGCITCHQVVDDSLSSGGILAPELTNVFSRLDEAAPMKIIRFPYHLTMQQAYEDKQVTEQESQALLAFFKNAASNTMIQKKRDERAAGFLKRLKKN